MENPPIYDDLIEEAEKLGVYSLPLLEEVTALLRNEDFFDAVECLISVYQSGRALKTIEPDEVDLGLDYEIYKDAVEVKRQLFTLVDGFIRAEPEKKPVDIICP